MALMQAYKTLKLTNRGEVKVSPEDYDHLNQYKWRQNKFGYVFRYVWMHREVNGTPDDLFTDHRDGDKLNNTRENLRSVTHSENGRNTKKRTDREYTSKFKGVFYDKKSGYFVASVKLDRGVKTSHHSKELDAAIAYNELARRYYGEHANLNDIPETNGSVLRRKSSKYRGVTKPKRGRWKVQIRMNGKTLHFGCFATELEAAQAYNAAAIELCGDRAKLNPIPEETYGKG